MKKFFLSAFIIVNSSSLFATHIIGGEIAYKNLGSSTYEITVKIYRDCFNGVPPLDSPAYFSVFNAANNLVDSMTVGWATDSIIPLNVIGDCMTMPYGICVEEGTYIFQAYLPAIAGGYKLVYQRCCRSQLVLNLLDPGLTGSTYIMQLNDACFTTANSSPVFAHYPPLFICVNEPFVFDNSAIDTDGDSLVYELCNPNMGAEVGTSQPIVASPPPYTPVSYALPYSYSNPMDGNPSLAIDPATGTLTITPLYVGEFVVGVCVSEYRNGIFLGTHSRDYVFNVLNCQTVLSVLFAANNSYANTPVAFTNNSSASSGVIISRLWKFGDGDTSTLQNPVHIYSAPGTYEAKLIESTNNGCTDSSTVLLHILDSLTIQVDEISVESKDLTFYPNPASNELTVQLLNNLITKNITVTDVLGREILSQQAHSQLSILNCQLFAKGVYFIKVQMLDGSVTVRRFIKD